MEKSWKQNVLYLSLTLTFQCHNFMKAVQNKLLVCITGGNKRVKPGHDTTNYVL
jgi:hypothetical protein